MNNTDAEDPGNDLPGKSRRASNSGSVMAAPGSNPPSSGHGQGYGKVILLGEHFVLYGMRAIAAALQCQTECHIVIRSIPEAEQAVPTSSDSSQQPVEDEATCVLGTKWIIHDARPAVVGYISQKKNEQRVAHARILKHLGLRNLTTDERLKNKELHVYLAGTLRPTSGNGASAADVVSVTRALNNLFNLGLSDDAVNQCALVGETGYHDTPSGIDNTVATFGGVILYRRGRGYVPKVSFKRVVRPPSEDVLNATKESNDGCFARRPLILRVLCISTGITSGTSEVIKEVRKIMEQDDVQFQKKFLNPYNELVDRALDALMVEDLTTFGQCMYENHKLLKQLTVSCAELDAIVEIAESNNALGAKMTGTGRGGMAIVLCQDEVQQRALSEVFASHKDIARHVWPTSLQVM